jgi:serine/threonine protein kinase
MAAPKKSSLTMLPLTPTKLGRYEIVDEIGKGAMGIVYLARDPLIGRLVALKTFRIGYSVKDQEMEQFRIRFMREAQSAGILTHPHIVTIHDVVEASEEGLAFIAMEYVRGTNLKLMLQAEQPLTLPAVLDILSQVGDALDYAHANRVVHRDVKPANILITNEGRVKITDFGIARLDSSNLTQEGQLLGTPNYMAPEQIQGKEVDHRADLFSLGVVLYEMLTRHKPFQGENLTVVSHRIVYDPFTPPRELGQSLPPGVERILTRALEKDPARRYQRAKEMVEDLRRVVETAAAPRADDLNETQSLSSTMALPPPPLPSPSLATDATVATGTGRGAGSSAAPAPPPSSGAPSLADTVATAAPAKAPRPAGRLSPRRLLAVGGAAAALVLLLWGGALLYWEGLARQAGPQRNAEEDAHRARVLELVHEGRQAGEAGNWPVAVYYFRQAEQLEPKGKRLQGLRAAAEQKVAQQYSQDAGRASVIAMGLANAGQALAAQSWDAALAAATTVLGIDPQNVEARTILVKAQEGQARRARQPRRTPAAPQPGAGEEVATAAPIPSEAPSVRPSPPSAHPEATTATLRIHFRSEVPEATVVVWANRKEIFRKTYGGRGLFHKQQDGPVDDSASVSLPAGTVDLLVNVTPAGKAALVRKPSGNLPGGSNRALEIQLSGPAQLAVDLR